MTFQKRVRIGGVVVFLGLCCLLITAVSCRKSDVASSRKAEQQRLEWNLNTTVEAYNRAGFANPAWDEPARKCLEGFARSRVVIDTNGSLGEIIGTNATLAVNAGCNDPMVNYLYIRFSMAQTNSKEAFLAAFCRTATEMNASPYPPVRKFYVAARAADQMFYTYGYGTNVANRTEWNELTPILNQSLPVILADKSTPAQEAYEVSKLALYFKSGSPQGHQRAYEMIEKPLFENWPNAYTTWFLKGSYYISRAWEARGSGEANTVAAEGWIGFSNNLAVAQEALEHAWKLDPKQSDIADEMITVMLGQGGGRDRMELWFNRAMEVNTNDYNACYKKLNYLDPKWYGSDEDQLAFGRECAQSTKWGGRVPLTLVDALESIGGRIEGEAQTNYWKRSEVWSDIETAYDRFFELNPDATGWYQNYALYAYRAEQWNKLNELIPKLGPANYNFFGGKDQFDAMVAVAKEHGGKN